MATVLTPAEIKQKITDWITTNGQGDITGAHLNTILAAIMDYVGVGYALIGEAPASAPSPDVPSAYLAAPGTYTNYESGDTVIPEGSIAVLKYDGSAWSKSVIKVCDPVSVSQNTETGHVDITVGNTTISAVGVEEMDNIAYKSLPFNNVGYALRECGSLGAASNFSTTAYIPVQKGQRFVVNGLSGSPENWATVCGYTEPNETSFVDVIVPGFNSTTQRATFVIPDGINYIRAGVCNDTDTRYIVAFLGILATDYIGEDTANKIDDLTADIETIMGQIDMSELEQYPYGSTYGPGIYWTTGTPTIVAGKYRVVGATNGITVISLARELSAATVTRTVTPIPLGGGNYEIYILDSDITAGVAYVRIQVVSASDVITFGRVISGEPINTVVKQIKSRIGSIPNLTGKKISVIGDSISTISGNNNPYWKVQSVDVGQIIQSYVTWWDVWNNEDGTTPTNKTIGGVALTAAMIGTLQTFTPVSEDVGKSIGVPANYNASTTKVWSEKLCELTGAVLLANASWSGARICSGQTDTWVLSEAWSDYTIGCCKIRDNEGNVVTPDIIIIYRGTNDFSHGPISRINPISLSNGVPATDYINDVYEYEAGYYKTIQKLRETYPKAYIIICTLNVFKRVTYDKYPTRNGYYTLPEMNDCIRRIADVMGCGLIEFDKDGITFENCYAEGYITDSATTPTHPNSKGHTVMAEKALSDMRYILQH